MRVSYTVRDARWLPLYDARLDTGGKDKKPSLELVRRAEIVQRTGEDWANVSLAVSTVRTARGGSAPNLNTVIVRYPQPVTPPAPIPRPQAAAPASRAAGAMLDTAREKSAVAAEAVEERVAVAETGGFQVLFRIPGRVSLGAGEGARSLRIASATIAPELLVRAAPVVDETAYLEATFKQAEEAPLLPGRVSVYRDGTFVGRGQMALAQKDETVRLGFGADEQVKVTRSVVRKNDGTAGIITASKTDEREFKIVVRNGHVAPVKMTIEEQLPVAENSEIQVEMLPSSTQPDPARRARPARRDGLGHGPATRRDPRREIRLARALADREVRGVHAAAAVRSKACRERSNPAPSPDAAKRHPGFVSQSQPRIALSLHAGLRDMAPTPPAPSTASWPRPRRASSVASARPRPSARRAPRQSCRRAR